MKVDTKKMSPMKKVAPDNMKDSPDSCLFHQNKYIEDGVSPLNKNGCHEEESDGGFWIRWIPTIFYTPVKCSQREKIEDKQRRKDTLDANGVEELNEAFAKLLINNKKEKEETKDCAEEKHNGDDDDDEQELVKEEKLGRYEIVRESETTARKIKMTRSYRLAEQD
jgi:hypothetical protein